MTLLATSTRYRGETVDLVAVGRFVSGGRPLPELTDAEQEYAAQVMIQAGLSTATVAARLGVADRTVTRWRSAWAHGEDPDTPHWQTNAACNGEDPDRFFPIGTASGELLAQNEAAKAVCRRCPVMDQCQQWALEHRIRDGVWGGLDETQLRNILRRRGKGTGLGRKKTA